MSGLLMSAVKQSSLPLRLKRTAEAFAECAYDNGSVYPRPMAYLAWLSEQCASTVRSHAAELRRLGVLVQLQPPRQHRTQSISSCGPRSRPLGSTSGPRLSPPLRLPGCQQLLAP